MNWNFLNPVKPQIVTLPSGKQTYAWDSKSEYDRWIMWNYITVGGLAVLAVLAGVAGAMTRRRK